MAEKENQKKKECADCDLLNKIGRYYQEKSKRFEDALLHINSLSKYTPKGVLDAATKFDDIREVIFNLFEQEDQYFYKAMSDIYFTLANN